MRKALLFLLLLLSALAPKLSASLVFGGFDPGRGGVSSIDSAGTSEFRDNITTNFPGSTFTSIGTLTTAYLSTVDIVMLCAARGDVTQISPLTVSEQNALLAFVQAGGSVLLFLDHNVLFEEASDSMGMPFGIDSTGIVNGTPASTLTNPTHPIAAGLFGTVTGYSNLFPGWFNSLGANAVTVGTLGGGSQPSLAAIAPGQLGVGSGGAIFFSDSLCINSVFTADVATITNNAVAWFTGAPKTQKVMSTFDTDLDGWTVSNAAAVWMAANGNPDGFLFFDNPEDITISEVVAPAKFLGDLRGYIGGSIGFDANLLSQADLPYGAYGTITIEGPFQSATLDIVSIQPPVGVWKSYSIPFTASAWGKTESEWLALMADVTGLRITLEAVYGEETNGVDNIFLRGPLSLEYAVTFTGPKSGTIVIANTVVGCPYILRRSENLDTSAEIERKIGTGGDLSFSYDDTAANPDRAFYWVEVP